LLQFPEELPGLAFLLRCQVLPGFHAIQHAFLLLWRQAAESLQPFTIFLLPLRRKVAKLRIPLQLPLLLFWRKISVLPQPLASVVCRLSLALRRSRWLTSFLVLLASLGSWRRSWPATRLSRNRSGGEHQGCAGDCYAPADEFQA
jgi:hypothetical protein